MFFSEESDVTVVITSCGRMDLLKETLDSFFKFNTYPIKEIIITEDSGDQNIHNIIPEKYKSNFNLIINKNNIGQIRSIDKAYSKVKSKYIFHCEEDWLFYRKGFIEDSKSVLEADSNIYQVWLRSFYHDVKRDYPFHSLGEEIPTHGPVAHKLLSSREKWQGFSFNPGLRRKSDYLKITGGYSSFLSDKKQAINVESELSRHIKENNCYAAILENDAVAHIGYDNHLDNPVEKKNKIKKKLAIAFSVFVVFSLGFLAASIVTGG